MVDGSASSLIVVVRSAAEIPVVMPSLASTVTVKAVPLRSWLTRYIGGRSSRSQSGAGQRRRRSRPEEYRTVNATSSGVASSAAKIRSPSFSRSSSSTTTTARPAAISATANSMVSKPAGVFSRFGSQAGRSRRRAASDDSTGIPARPELVVDRLGHRGRRLRRWSAVSASMLVLVMLTPDPWPQAAARRTWPSRPPPGSPWSPTFVAPMVVAVRVSGMIADAELGSVVVVHHVDDGQRDAVDRDGALAGEIPGQVGADARSGSRRRPGAASAR